MELFSILSNIIKSWAKLIIIVNVKTMYIFARLSMYTFDDD